MFDYCNFNRDLGYYEALVRGFRNTLLNKSEYENIVQCENLEDVKLNLQSLDYAGYLTCEGPISPAFIEQKLREKLVLEFEHVRNQAPEPLATFLDYMTYSYMIDNVILLITGIVNNRPINELVSKCHPLGSFDQMEAVNVAQTPEELYDAVIVDTPLAPFFVDCISQQDLSELNIEIIRNSLFKSYIETFYNHCKKIGGRTAEVMCEILGFEADRRCFNITINSLDSSLTRDDRASLYPTCGLLYPFGTDMLAKAEDFEHVRQVAEYYPPYKALFDGQTNVNSAEEGKTLEDKFTEYEVKLNANAFMHQFTLAPFYSILKLKEQELRNIVWISECISQKHRQKIDNYIPIFAD